jgi:hypothetical protein
MTETAPDTLGYLILGLIVATAIMAAFIGSMVARYRNLERDVDVLEQLGDEP